MEEELSDFRLEYLYHEISKNYVEKCGKLTTNEDRFLLALKVVVRNSAVLFDSSLGSEQKNSQHSVKSRESGNSSFKYGEYYKAVQQYTESIVYAADSSEDLAVAYANRSAALFKLMKYADCIEDIDRALSQNYPNELKTKLYQRKGLCLRTLARPGADCSFMEALLWLDKMNLNKTEVKKTRSELGKLIASARREAKPPPTVRQYPLPAIVAPNLEASSASDAIAIKYSKQFGRHFVATRKIKPGEVLVVEKPYCLRLKPTHIYTHCSFCLQVSWNMIPCQYCIHVAYCSESCKEKAWHQYHEVECPVIAPLLPFKLNNVVYISMRMAIMTTQKGAEIEALRTELATVDRNKDPRTKGYGDDGKFHSDQYRSIYSLSDNIDKCSTQEHLVRAFWTALTVCVIAKETKMFGKKLPLHDLAKNSDVIFVGSLILKHIHTVFTNVQSFGGSRHAHASDLGDAILAVSSLINHSCDPNTIRQRYTDSAVLYASYPIEQGEQIFDNYGPRFFLMERRQRQAYFDRWYFKCGCNPCKSNWPMLEYLPSYKSQPLAQDDKKILNRNLQKSKVNNSAIQKGILENSQDVLKELLEMIELLSKLTQRPCAELIMVLSMLKDYYEAADATFEYEPVNATKIIKERSMYYLLFHKRLYH